MGVIRTGGQFSFGDIATMHVDGTQFKQITHYGYNSDPVLSPDRKRIAYRSVPQSITSSASQDRLYGGYYNIWVITVDGAQAWQLTFSEARRSIPSWSPDSRKVVLAEDMALVEIEVDNPTPRTLTQGAAAPRHRPDGSGIGYITVGGGLAWIDAEGKTHTIVPTATLPMSTTIYDFDWLPDGQHVVYTLAHENAKLLPGRHDYSTWITPVDGSAPTELLGREPFGYGPRNVQVSPDGKIVSIIGSSYGDVCAVGVDASFLLLAPDLKSAQLVTSQDFKGRPEKVVDFYSTSGVIWISSHLALTRFAVTCPDDEDDMSGAGIYLIDPAARRMVQITH